MIAKSWHQSVPDAKESSVLVAEQWRAFVKSSLPWQDRQDGQIQKPFA